MVVGIVDSYSRGEDSEVIELAAIERQVGGAVRAHHHAKRGVLGLQQWLSALHFHGLLGTGHAHDNIHPGLLVDLEDNPLLYRRTKPRGRNRDVVSTGGEIRDAVVAGRGADRLLAASSASRRDGDRGAGNNSAAAVGHRP